MRDPRIEAIRNSNKVGHDTMSVVQMTYSDDDIYDELTRHGILTEEDAVDWAIQIEKSHCEQALNYREGNDHDPELARFDEVDQW